MAQRLRKVMRHAGPLQKRIEGQRAQARKMILDAKKLAYEADQAERELSFVFPQLLEEQEARKKECEASHGGAQSASSARIDQVDGGQAAHRVQRTDGTVPGDSAEREPDSRKRKRSDAEPKQPKLQINIKTKPKKARTDASRKKAGNWSIKERRKLSMIVVLPKAKDGLDALEEKLDAPTLAGWLKQEMWRPVRLRFPKFEFAMRRDVIGDPVLFARRSRWGG